MTSLLRRSHHAAALGVAALLVALPLHAQGEGDTTPVQTVDAWSLTAHMQTRIVLQGANDSTGRTVSMGFSTIRSAHASRVSFDVDMNGEQPGARQFLLPGQIMLVTESGADTIMTVLDTVQETYRQLPKGRASALFGGSGPASVRGAAGLRVSDLAITIDSIGNGPVLQGHHTIHYRKTQRATLRMGTNSTSSLTMRMTDTTDIDIATDIHDPLLSSNPFPFMRAMNMSSAMASTPATDSVLRAAAKKYPSGFPLRVQSRVSTEMPFGVMLIHMSMDVDTWSHAPVDAALFTVPSSYTPAPEDDGPSP